MQQHYDRHTVPSRYANWHRQQPGTNQVARASEHQTSLPPQTQERSSDPRRRTWGSSRSSPGRSRSRSPSSHNPRAAGNDQLARRDGLISLTQPHCAEKLFQSRDQPRSPLALHPPPEGQSRIFFRSVDRNKNLAGNKVSPSRCRDDQMLSPPHPPLPPPGETPGLTPVAIPTGPRAALPFSADGQPPRPEASYTPHPSLPPPGETPGLIPAAIPTGPRAVPPFSADGQPPRPGGPWTPIQRYHLEKLLMHGCVTNTEGNARGVEDVWLKVSPERGGGYGFGLTAESVMRYITHQSDRFKTQGPKRKHGRQKKWRRWLLENRETAMKSEFGTERGIVLQMPPRVDCETSSGRAAAESAPGTAGDSLLPLVSTPSWSPPYVPDAPEEYDEKPWWEGIKSSLQPAMSVLSTASTPGVGAVLEAIRAVTAKQAQGTGNSETTFLSSSLTPRSNGLGSSEISQLTTASINTTAVGPSVFYSYPVQQPFPATPTAPRPLSPPPEAAHTKSTATSTPTPSATAPFEQAISSTSQSCSQPHHPPTSRASTHLHLQIHVTRGQHHALLDHLLDMPGDITLHNSSLSNGDGDGKQMIFIKVEVPRDYRKFMATIIGGMPGVRVVVGMED